jgi:hypothetical protein
MWLRGASMMGSAESGAKISGLCVGSAPINCLGMTPTTVNGVLAMISLRPTTSGARLNHLMPEAFADDDGKSCGTTAALVVFRGEIAA